MPYNDTWQSSGLLCWKSYIPSIGRKPTGHIKTWSQEMGNSLQELLSNAFSWDYYFCIFTKISLGLFVRVQCTITQQILLLAVKHTISHYLNKWWSSSLTHVCINSLQSVKTLRPSQNGRLFADNIFICIFLKVNVWILKFVPKGPINYIPALSPGRP